MSEPKVRLDLYEDRIIRTVFEAGTPCSKAELSARDVTRAFAGMITSTTLLPENALFAGEHESHTLLGIWVPWGGRPALRVDGLKQPLVVRLPPLIFAGAGTIYWVHAVQGDAWPQPDTRLFHAPFPNVYGDGRICPGQVDFPPCLRETILDALALFLQSAFTRDLGRGKSEHCPDDITQLWRQLNGLFDEYPVSDLQPTGQTLGERLSHWGRHVR
jgi:PRTRC genetic system protein B